MSRDRRASLHISSLNHSTAMAMRCGTRHILWHICCFLSLVYLASIAVVTTSSKNIKYNTSRPSQRLAAKAGAQSWKAISSRFSQGCCDSQHVQVAENYKSGAQKIIGCAQKSATIAFYLHTYVTHMSWIICRHSYILMYESVNTHICIHTNRWMST